MTRPATSDAEIAFASCTTELLVSLVSQTVGPEPSGQPPSGGGKLSISFEIAALRSAITLACGVVGVGQ